MDIVLVLKINKMSSIRKLGFRWTKCNQSLQCLSLCCLNKELFRNMADVPVIKFPVSFKRKMISRQTPKKNATANSMLDIARPGKLLVSCDNKKQSMYTNEFCSKFNPPTIASSTWTSRKSPGRYVTIHAVRDANPSFKSNDEASFESLNLSEEILEALQMNKFSTPTVIQAKAIPEILNGNNVMLAAETGSGKTLAYLLPICQALLHLKDSEKLPTSSTSPLAVILIPTQELVRQVVNMTASLKLPFTCQSIKISNTKFLPRLRTPHVLVATPAALIHALRKRKFDLNQLMFMVIDECDSLLDDSFASSVSTILKHFNIKSGVSTPLLGGQCAQLILSSATYPKYAQDALQEIISFDDIVAVRSGYLHRISPHVKHGFLRVKPSEKFNEFMKILEGLKNSPTIVFCNKHNTAAWLHSACQENAIPSLYIGGRINPKARSGRLRDFLQGDYGLLITTDLLSRGLDTKRVKHVVNYDVPGSASDYLHRCGRVGRVGQDLSATVTTLVSQKWEVDVVMQVEEATRPLVSRASRDGPPSAKGSCEAP